MRARVGKWGNSLALRIPRSFALEAGLEQNSPVELSLDEHGQIVIKPVRGEAPSLEDLLAGVTADNMHGEIDSGDPVGGEVW
jgi:antitoxin MazE